MDLADSDELARAVQAQAQAAIEEADVIAAGRGRPGGAGPRRRRARRRCCAVRSQPVLVAANKIDRPGEEALTAELNALGLGEPMPVSATHGLGTGDLLDRIIAELAPSRRPSAEPERRAAAADRDPRAARTSASPRC